MVVVAIDQNDPCLSAPKSLDGVKASKPASDDDDTRSIMLRRLEGVFSRDFVRRLRLHHDIPTMTPPLLVCASA
jgi:hypothetical protein